MVLTKEKIESMKAVDILTVDPAELTDLNEVVIDTRKNVTDRISQYASQTNNLFINRVGDYVVKVSYANTGVTVNDKLKKHITKLAEIYY
ncbi:MAG: hypothetical protein LBV33_00970 [Lachnospiraceae bacterium]|jgi:ssRNA-specific RNase YbeY (16S rRNA maturation enzyme)|nr:hypothetical protein [Lachnospiraceae bacterium]